MHDHKTVYKLIIDEIFDPLANRLWQKSSLSRVSGITFRHNALKTCLHILFLVLNNPYCFLDFPSCSLFIVITANDHNYSQEGESAQKKSTMCKPGTILSGAIKVEFSPAGCLLASNPFKKHNTVRTSHSRQQGKLLRWQLF